MLNKHFTECPELQVHFQTLYVHFAGYPYAYRYWYVCATVIPIPSLDYDDVSTSSNIIEHTSTQATLNLLSSREKGTRRWCAY